MIPGVDTPGFINTTDNATMHVATDVPPGTQFILYVRAFTVAFGPFSDQLIIHTADGEGGCCAIYYV